MAPRPRCPVCRSRRWHRDALSGSIVCEEGHLLAGYVQESTEQEYASQHVLQTRRERKNKGKKQRLPTNDYFHGDRATFLVWQCMQLILREQLRVLVDELGWPVELEAVARDLFALLVASSQIPPAPSDFDKGQENPGSYSGPRPGDRFPKRGRQKYGPRGRPKPKTEHDLVSEEPVDDDDDDAAERRSVVGEHDNNGTRDDGEDEAERHSETSEGESSPSSYYSDADDERPRPGGPSRRTSPTISAAPSPGPGALDDPVMQNLNPYAPPKPRPPVHAYGPRQTLDPRAHPRLDFLLYIIHLACITLRLPVFLSDIFKLAETYRIPYLDAAKHLPLDMQSHLSQSYRALLSPVSLPNLFSSDSEGPDLHSSQAWLARLVRMYREDWDVEFPEANLPLVMGRLCRLLALPPIVHVVALRLLSLLPQPISFHLPNNLTSSTRSSFSPRNAALAASSTRERGLPKEFSWRSRLTEHSHDWRLLLPEVKIASVLVVAAKMVWTLEDDSRPMGTFLADLADGLPDSHTWLDTVESLGRCSNPGDRSVLWRNRDPIEMRDSEIDAYLDFFESHIVSATKVPKFLNDLGRFFPEPEKPISQTAPSEPRAAAARIDALIASAYSKSTACATPLDASQYPAQAQVTTPDLVPQPVLRLLAAISGHILSIPTPFALSLQGPASTLLASGFAYLSPQITRVERLLAVRSVPLQRLAKVEDRAQEKKLWSETKELAHEFVKDQGRTEMARRKRVDSEVKLRRREEAHTKRQEKKAKPTKVYKTKDEIGQSSEDEIESEIAEEMRILKLKNGNVPESIGDDEDDEVESTSDSEAGPDSLYATSRDDEEEDDDDYDDNDDDSY
ncbi:TFIIB-type zinc finger domain-containing protein [Sporobolomyces koalae]|uniref:TFIIB-type zinc finger domain-containing protein n=1 Tax=Sporobolomyces koalae TaxID=500713 RepID=UPI00316B95D3